MTDSRINELSTTQNADRDTERGCGKAQAVALPETAI